MNNPNIIFLNTDQQSWEALSARGNEWIDTPNLDRLHRNGVTFTRSYCSDPVCGPTRASWVTGRYTSEHGVVLNGVPIHNDIPDLGQILNRNGYHAAHAGKWHVAGREMSDSFHDIYLGRVPIGASGGQIYDPATTHAAIDFLLHCDDAKPFFLELGVVNPHDICHFGSRYGSEDIPDDLGTRLIPSDELPPVFPNSSFDDSEVYTHTVFRRGRGAMYHDETNQVLQQWDELNWRYYRWNYYRFIEEADREIGLVLDVIEQSPWRDDTLIVFSPDHGDACGRHNTFQKFNLYEESVRVPLIVSSFGDRFGIEKGARDTGHFVSAVDLMPTVLDYAGVPVPETVQGRSVRPLVEGRKVADWPEYVYIESNYWSRAVVTDRYKYITEYVPKGTDEDWVPPGPDTNERGVEQLFDLGNDPGETVNLVADPDHAAGLESCRKLLVDHEARLHRRRINPGHDAQIRHSAKRIREYYRQRGA